MISSFTASFFWYLLCTAYAELVLPIRFVRIQQNNIYRDVRTCYAFNWEMDSRRIEGTITTTTTATSSTQVEDVCIVADDVIKTHGKSRLCAFSSLIPCFAWLRLCVINGTMQLGISSATIMITANSVLVCAALRMCVQHVPAKRKLQLIEMFLFTTRFFETIVVVCCSCCCSCQHHHEHSAAAVLRNRPTFHLCVRCFFFFFFFVPLSVRHQLKNQSHQWWRRWNLFVVIDVEINLLNRPLYWPINDFYTNSITIQLSLNIYFIIRFFSIHQIWN